MEIKSCGAKTVFRNRSISLKTVKGKGNGHMEGNYELKNDGQVSSVRLLARRQKLLRSILRL